LVPFSPNPAKKQAQALKISTAFTRRTKLHKSNSFMMGMKQIERFIEEDIKS
jgi:hypothetical protein